jgi:hypothetical protein
MGEVREREPGVCCGKLLVGNHRGDRIETRPAEALLDRDAEKAELTELSEQFDVESLRVVE